MLSFISVKVRSSAARGKPHAVASAWMEGALLTAPRPAAFR
jgi:hypothetical protein